MDKLPLFVILALFTIFGTPSIIGLIVTPIIKLGKYMREREKEGRNWIDPSAQKTKSMDKENRGGKV